MTRTKEKRKSRRNRKMQRTRRKGKRSKKKEERRKRNEGKKKKHRCNNLHNENTFHVISTTCACDDIERSEKRKKKEIERGKGK